jgi:phospholipid/cholesterol/gamma-HCH transport system substrate-binding protein
MPKISRELRTGIIAILVIAIFIWGFSFLKGINLFESSRVFYAQYENVQGLESSAPVTINGLKVGTILNIDFHPRNQDVLVVKFSLDNDLKFSKNSIAQIYSPDFISGKSIKLLTGKEGDNAISGDTLVGNVELGILGTLNDQIAPLQAKFQSFVINADSLVGGFNEIFDANTKKNLRESVAKLNTTLTSFNSVSKSLDGMLAENGKIDSVLSNANKASMKLVSITDSLNDSNIKATVQKLEVTLNNFNNILSNLDNGEGSMGKLLKDEGLYNNLKGASKEMEELLREMKLNPKRFVHFSLFGKKPKPYQSEEPSN